MNLGVGQQKADAMSAGATSFFRTALTVVTFVPCFAFGLFLFVQLLSVYEPTKTVFWVMLAGGIVLWPIGSRFEVQLVWARIVNLHELPWLVIPGPCTCGAIAGFLVGAWLFVNHGLALPGA